MVRVRLFAAAREAAGTGELQVTAGTVGELVAVLVARHPQVADVIAKCSILVDGVRSGDSIELPEGVTVDILPPFSGG